VEILSSTEVLNEVVIQLRLSAPVYTELVARTSLPEALIKVPPVVVEASDPDHKSREKK